MRNKPYRAAYVAQNTGHDFTGLLKLVDELVFVTSGYEEEDQLSTAVKKGLAGFNPSTDLVVPVGNVFVNILMGEHIATYHHAHGSFNVALFQDKEYHVRPVWIHRRSLGEANNAHIPN